MQSSNCNVSLNQSLVVKMKDVISEKCCFFVNESEVIKENKKTIERKKLGIILAILHRMEDETRYLNSIVLTGHDEFKTAFEFIDFMNHAYVLLEGIDYLARLFKTDTNEIDNSSEIFVRKHGTDKSYFKFLRSLCAVHPFNTSRFRNYMESDVPGCCPLVAWTTGNEKKKGELRVTIYECKKEFLVRHIYIKVSEIIQYVCKRYDLMNKIIVSAEEKIKEKSLDLANTPILTPEDYDDYNSYLKMLSLEASKRDDNYVSDIEQIIKIFSFKFGDSVNDLALNIYKDALKYAVKFLHKYLQKMRETKCIDNGKDKICASGTMLFEKILRPDCDNCGIAGCAYCIEKIGYYYSIEKINPDAKESTMHQANVNFQKMLPFIKRFVRIGSEDAMNRYLLLKIAMFLNCVDNPKSALSQQLPDEIKKRADEYKKTYR